MSEEPFYPPEAFNLAEWLLDARVAEGRGGRTAIVTAERNWSYADVLTLANRCGNLLREAGIEPEQRIVVSLPDGPEYVGALLGAIKVGAVPVMLNPSFKTEDFEYFLSTSRAKAAFVQAETWAAFGPAAARSPHLTRSFVLGSASYGALGLAESLARVSDRLAPAGTHRDDPALWLFSGGTTGRPKAVVQTHASFANTTVLYAQRHLGYREDDRVLSIPKLFFGYATGCNLFFPFSIGAASILFPERATPEALFEQIGRHRPTILIHVPTMVNQMVNHPDAERQDLSSIRFATSAGEALPAELYGRWKKTFGVELLDGLGTAEMWHIFVSNRLGDVGPGTVGRVVPGFEIRVCDEDGNSLPDGEIGMLWVKGRSRAIGYWQLAEKTAAAFRGEWYLTGDLVRRDAEGRLVHCGRADDMVKVSGKWLSPSEVENCLMKHPAVKECAVVAVADAAGLVKPHAYVVAPGSTASLATELQEFVKKSLEPYKYPREVFFLDTLPRTHLGKVDRAALKRASAPAGIAAGERRS